MTEQLYSFDIYDTLITRKTATPEGVFALMQKKLSELEEYADFPERLAHNFYLLRIQAEKVARNTYIAGEIHDITISQIYDCIRLLGEVTKDQAERLMTLEIETEMENSLPIFENIEKVRELNETGKRVVLISNMYLRNEDIRKILLQMDSIFQDITIYVSGDLTKTKGTGTLYHYIRQQENVEFANWYHLGDDWKLDVIIPKSMGIKADYFKKAELLDWEKEILTGRESNPELQLLIGVSKNVRKGDDLHFPYLVGSGYGAEILLPYVLWVLKESLAKGIYKLFFVARDGYILKRMADIVIAKYSYPITTAYVYGSRKAWRLPSINQNNFDLQEFFTLNYPGQIFSYQQIAEILGLTTDELKIFLPFIREEYSELSQSLVQEIMTILREKQEEIASFIYQKQKEKREAAVNYLFQEMGEEVQEFAFVDLIGSGYTQRCLADLLEGFYDKPIRTFFYRLDSCKQYKRNLNYVYFPNRIKMGNVIEVLCGAPHGQTNGYEVVEGIWAPVLGKDEGEKLESYGFNDYLNGIEEYTREFVRHFPTSPLGLEDLSVLAIYFDYMSEVRSQKLYDFVADMPYGITGQEKTVTSFAPRLSNKALSQIYFWHKDEPVKKYYSGYSIEFSLKRLSSKQERRLHFYQKHSEDTVVKWIRRHYVQSKVKICSHRYELIASRIVLYGAGKRGRLLYSQLTSGKQYHADIVLWVDRDYQKYTEQSLNVQAPENILQTDYQQVVIAVAKKDLAEEIKEGLIQMGVPGFRILWICPDSKIR